MAEIEVMSFRRRRDEWNEFVKQHGSELRSCGIPDVVFSTRMRFLSFLEHGFDEWGWVENRDTCFHPNALSDEQVARLAEFVGRYIDRVSIVAVASRWRRI